VEFISTKAKRFCTDAMHLVEIDLNLWIDSPGPQPIEFLNGLFLDNESLKEIKGPERAMDDNI